MTSMRLANYLVTCEDDVLNEINSLCREYLYQDWIDLKNCVESGHVLFVKGCPLIRACVVP